MKNNLLKDKYSELLNEWDYEKNRELGIDINMVTCGSSIKAWWECSVCNGLYEMTVKNRTAGHGCPYCIDRKVLRGFNDLLTCFPELVKSEWDWVRNDKNGLKPDEITKTSCIKTWWRCKQCRNSFKMSPSDRNRGRGCPYCAGRKVMKGFNDLASCYPKLVKYEWDYEKNEISPDEITYGVRKKTWWHCAAYHHEYMMSVSNRIKGHGCPYCAGKKALRGFNDLQSCYPELMQEWNWNANNNAGIKPDEITGGSTIEACWHCTTCNGDYMMAIRMKTKGIGCPYCAGKRVLKGFNDLASQYTDLLSEWNYENNDKHGIKPDEIAVNSSLMASWICSKCKHEWNAKIYNRTINKSGCPACWQASHKSKQEDEVAEYINDYLISNYAMHFNVKRSIAFREIYNSKNINVNNNDDISKYVKSMRKEIDIYIPELSLAVEYDGDYWHNDSVMLAHRGMTNDDAHMIKQELCKQAGITLVFITEHDWLHDNEKVKRRITDMIDSSIAK